MRAADLLVRIETARGTLCRVVDWPQFKADYQFDASLDFPSIRARLLAGEVVKVGADVLRASAVVS